MPPETPETTLEALLDFVEHARGFDFTGYKRSSIERRVAKRMREVGVGSYGQYVDRLRGDPDEFAALFDAILLSVTGFFRDEPTWEYLATDVVPEIVEARPGDAPLRVWCAGCASGEEAYTVAMVFATVLGERAFRERVKVYATDVDPSALDQARHGAYAARDVEGVPREALDRFFERDDGRYVFRSDLRRGVVFGRNDLVRDAPISRIDLLVCRNTLMYFDADTQGRILRRFHLALADDGRLLLGKSDMLFAHANLFVPVALKRRVFRKALPPALHDGVGLLGDGLAGAGEADLLRERAFDLAGVAQVIADQDGSMVVANDQARRMFNLSTADVGRPLRDLELSSRPVELRVHLDRLQAGGRAIAIEAVRWCPAAGHERFLDIRLTPLVSDGEVVGSSITYADVTGAHGLRDELAGSRRELERAYEQLRSAVEDLETTSEQLQSAVEGLDATNEELESANDELETMNDELRQRTFELEGVNTILETILATLGLAAAVVDRRRRVRSWSGQARRLWGLTAAEVEDRDLLALGLGLPAEQLEPRLRACLSGASPREQLTLGATDGRGEALRCRLTCLPLATGDDGRVGGLVVLMEPVGS
jgi:two-component system, chemotaxis family, CheB/CheR fusion protein